MTGIFACVINAVKSTLCTTIITGGGSGVCSTVFGSLCGGLGLSGINDLLFGLANNIQAVFGK